MSRISEKANCNIDDINELYRIVNNPDSQRQMVVRARIILLSNEGWQNKDIAEELGTNANLVGNWIKRYREGGLEALYDLHRSGRAGKNSSVDVFAAIQERLNGNSHTGNEQWSAADLAADLGVSRDRVWNALRSHKIDLDRKRSWDIVTGNGISSRQVDVAGLFISPTERAIVLCFAPCEQILEGSGVFSTKNRSLAEDISNASSDTNPALLNETLDAAARHAADNRRIAHMTLVSYMNRLIDTIESVKGLSYAVIFSGNGYVPTKSLRKSSILFHRTANEEEWLSAADFIMGRFCMPSEYLPLSESLRRYVGSINETTEDFIWMNYISQAYNESDQGQGADLGHVTSGTAQAERVAQGIEDNGTKSGAGLVLTATYTTESGEKKVTSVKIDGGDLPTRSGGSMKKEELLRYVSDLTAYVRPAIDRLGEDTCNMIINDIKKNG